MGATWEVTVDHLATDHGQVPVGLLDCDLAHLQLLHELLRDVADHHHGNV